MQKYIIERKAHNLSKNAQYINIVLLSRFRSFAQIFTKIDTELLHNFCKILTISKGKNEYLYTMKTERQIKKGSINVELL